MAPVPSGAVVGPVAGDAAQSKALLEKLVPPAPSEYRHLHDGYTSEHVAPWAEKRICLTTGSACLHATRGFKAGEVLSEFGARTVFSEPNYLTVQVDETSHIMLAPEYLQYINHSCAPNVSFDTTRFVLVALVDIAPGTELCFFYPSTEWTMAAPFKCCCGAAACCGTIAGASQMDADKLLTEHTLSDFIARKLRGGSSSGDDTTCANTP